MITTELDNYISTIEGEFNQIPDDRRRLLSQLGNYVDVCHERSRNANLVFICTHNSRRSHLAQVWAQVASSYYGFKDVRCYSGGTEETALYPSVVKALSETGLLVDKISAGKNPVYYVKYDENEKPIIGFSKPFGHAFNPHSDFVAVMTCGHADTNCPYIPHVELRLPVTYDDPKQFDNTSEEPEKYAERCRQIAREMLFAFSRVSN